MKILVVEDREDSRILLVKQIRAYGYEVMAAANGVEALEQALAEPPDIIVSDIMMPKMDGYQLCQECKQNDKLKDIPFVFYTATYIKEEDEKLGMSLGAITFIRKPTEPDDLVRMLSEIVEKAKSGTLAPPKVAPLEPSLFLTEYNKRIVAKLEEKMAQLEVEITEREQAEHNLAERVKERECLYSIVDIAGRPRITLNKLYQEVVNVLPKSWQYPEITCARIIIDDKKFETENYRDTEWKQPADIKVHNVKLGRVDVGYLEERPLIDEGPFLKEERSLIDAVAERLGRITERMQVEKELKLAEKNFRNSLDNSPLGIRIVTAEGEPLYANQAILDIYGYSSIEELEAVPTKQRYTPESYAEHQERIKRRNLGKPIPPTYEISIVRKDGKIRHLSVSRKEVVWSGEAQFQTLYQDITERKQAEEKLKESESFLNDIIEQSPFSTYISDDEGTNIRQNQACRELFGIERDEEVIGKYNMFKDEEARRQGFMPLIEEVFSKGKTVNLVIDYDFQKVKHVKVPKAAHKLLDITIFPIKDANGKVTNAVVQHKDITEREQAEEELRKHREHLEELVKERTRQLEEAVQAAEVATRAKSDFLASMSHELRTPLNAVIGFSQVLQEQYFGKLNEKQAEYVTDILESGQHLLSLINDILDLSKIEAGKLKLELSGVKIKDLLEGSLVMIKEKALAHGIKLDIDTTADLEGLEIMADERRLKQVMFNLLSNAAKFTPDGGAIRVEGRKEGKELLISVSDTGVGLAPKEQERVFEEFYQATGGIKGKTPGTGLGLPLTRNIVEMHGGRIWMESEGLGKGSRSTFTLPIGGPARLRKQAR